MKEHHKSLLAVVLGAAALVGVLTAMYVFQGPRQALQVVRPQTDDCGARLQRIVSQYADSLGEVSVCVYDITADSAVFDYHADKALAPASCQKIVTTFAAYDHLVECRGAFSDSLFMAGHVDRSGTLHGRLIFRGSYDPLLYDFKAYAEAIRAKGISRIEGDIDLRLAVTERYENADIPLKALPILYRGRGTVEAELKKAISSAGIKMVAAPSEAPTLPPSEMTEELLHATPHTFSEVLTHMMQYSDNRAAEAVFICLGGGQHGGAAVVRESLLKFFPGLSEGQCRVVDGSGLSYNNRASARFLTELLRVSYTYGLLGHYLVNEALPRSGQSGTLIHRFKGTPAENSIRAKTGTLPKYPASSLAGYCQSGRGHLLVFTIISNGTPEQRNAAYSELAKRFENELCIAMCS